MPEIKAIVFDLGNVLVSWNPRYVFDENYFPSEEKREYFFKHICTDAWNEETDAGRSIVEGTMQKIRAFPEWEPAIRDYYGRWTEMLKSPIWGTVEILDKLKQRGDLKLYALTNWNAELFDIALVRYNFFHWFDGRVVSGEEKITKPNPEIYQRLLDRYRLIASETIFIDDSLKNIDAARALGFITIHFQDAEQLGKKLSELVIV